MKIPSETITSLTDLCPSCGVGPEWVETDAGADYEYICGCCLWQVNLRPKGWDVVEGG
jgi:hypothetical protein